LSGGEAHCVAKGRWKIHIEPGEYWGQENPSDTFVGLALTNGCGSDDNIIFQLLLAMFAEAGVKILTKQME